MAFASRCTVSVGVFLEILSFYLASTCAEWKENVFMQKLGICIGQKVAPVLSNIFLGRVERIVQSNLGDDVIRVLCYGDDFFFFYLCEEF